MTKPIPVAMVQRIADECDKDIVILAAWEASTNLLHGVSYGKTAEQKVAAAYGIDSAVGALGGVIKERTTFEDFRGELESAENAMLARLAAPLMRLLRNHPQVGMAARHWLDEAAKTQIGKSL